jgi:hypothetical protein
METLVETTTATTTVSKYHHIYVLKCDINKLVEEQKFLKNQRKTEKIIGDRKMPAWEATYKHQANREKLRVMYAVYGFLRGKSFSQTENRFPEENHPLNKYQHQIDKLKEIYLSIKG